MDDLALLRSLVRSQIRRDFKAGKGEPWVQELVRLLEKVGGADLLLEKAGLDEASLGRLLSRVEES